VAHQQSRQGKRVVSTSIGYAQRTSNPKSLFLIFPDRATGDAERIRLLKDVYGDNSIASLIEAYAPRNENDTDGYIATVSKATGVDKSTRLDALTDDQFKKLTAAMAKHEGWIPGKIVPLGKPKTAELRDKLQQPLAGQPVALRGGKQEITVKTDAGGALPLLYPKLFEDKLSLYLDSTGKHALVRHRTLIDAHEKISLLPPQRAGLCRLPCRRPAAVVLDPSDEIKVSVKTLTGEWKTISEVKPAGPTTRARVVSPKIKRTSEQKLHEGPAQPAKPVETTRQEIGSTTFTRSQNGHPVQQVALECPNPENLRLEANHKYREIILGAS